MVEQVTNRRSEPEKNFNCISGNRSMIFLAA
jgi:hypothetical protein